MAAKRTKNALPALLPLPLQQRERPFYNVPTSPAANLISEVLIAGDNVADLPNRKKKINHNTALEVLEDGSKRQITLTSPKAQITIELADIEKLTGSNKTAKKMFILSLIKANEQALHEGELTRDYVSFPLQELVDIGFYTRINNARRGFNTGMDKLTSLKIKGHIQQTKKRETAIEGGSVLFTDWRIINGQCFIFLNSRINWSFVAQYYTILPKYYFKLPNRASDLLEYIFYLARQNTKGIEERGYFTISFRAIQQRLQLPSEIGNGNPYRTIKQPIDEAIEQIETEHSQLYGELYENREFELLPVVDEDASITSYLDNGYLQVTLRGAFASTFIAISEETAKQIENSQKRKARITEKAIAANLAKKLGSQDQKPE